MLPILPRKLPKVVVAGEHYVPKDLPFFEEAHEADVRARQERLDQREERRQEGTLRKAPSKRGQSSSSSVRPLIEKKKKKIKSTVRVVEAPDSRSASPPLSAPPPRIPVSLVNLAPDLEGESDSLYFDLDHSTSGVNLPTSESEPVTINVAYELEGEGMSSDLMTEFKKRIRKQLYKPIDVVVPATKRSRSAESRNPPVEEVPPAPVPLPDTAGSSSVLPTASSVREETQPTQDPAPADPAPTNPAPALVENDQKDAPPCADPSTWEEMKEMLEQTLCFTDPEPPLTKMSDLFSPTV